MFARVYHPRGRPRTVSLPNRRIRRSLRAISVLSPSESAVRFFTWCSSADLTVSGCRRDLLEGVRQLEDLLRRE